MLSSPEAGSSLPGSSRSSHGTVPSSSSPSSFQSQAPPPFATSSSSSSASEKELRLAVMADMPTEESTAASAGGGRGLHKGAHASLPSSSPRSRSSSCSSKLSRTFCFCLHTDSPEINARRRNILTSVALGQVLSFLIACTGTFSTLLSKHHLAVPTAQGTINYALLSLFFWSSVWKKGGLRAAWRSLQVPWWKYALLALADVEANFLVVMAYQYTTILSVMLLDCSSIPVVMLLSYKFLRLRYKFRHIVAVVICLAGLGALAAADLSGATASDGDSSAGTDGEAGGPASNVALGDALCVMGAALYAISNVGQESVVKHYGKGEFLGMLGLFGLFWNSIQLVVLERDSLASFPWESLNTLYLLGFALTLFAMYALTSVFLQKADATLFNLSLLTSDIWAIFISIFLFQEGIRPLYFLALAMVATGLVLYNTTPVEELDADPEGDGAGLQPLGDEEPVVRAAAVEAGGSAGAGAGAASVGIPSASHVKRGSSSGSSSGSVSPTSRQGLAALMDRGEDDEEGEEEIDLQAGRRGGSATGAGAVPARGAGGLAAGQLHLSRNSSTGSRGSKGSSSSSRGNSAFLSLSEDERLSKLLASNAGTEGGGTIMVGLPGHVAPSGSTGSGSGAATAGAAGQQAASFSNGGGLV